MAPDGIRSDGSERRGRVDTSRLVMMVVTDGTGMAMARRWDVDSDVEYDVFDEGGDEGVDSSAGALKKDDDHLL